MHLAIPTTRLNTTALGEAVAAELDIPLVDGRAAVQAVFDVIARAVAGGHPVAVTNFGTFLPVTREARTGRNPQTGETVPIPTAQDVRFRVSPGLRTTVRAADPASATIRKRPQLVRTAIQGTEAGR